MNRKKHLRIFSILLILFIVLTGCTHIGQELDPATLGYEMEVTYDAMGGVINQREIRQTNYAENSLLYEPRGTSNLLIAPTKTGYTLAGWYTNVKELPAENDEEPRYIFDPQDRWDFDVDRVQEDMTLYARWVNQATAQYIDAKSDEVVFSKDLTPSSPLAPLSEAILNMVGKKDATFAGYFQKNLKDEINFDEYEYSPLLPTRQALYDQLAEEFPKNIVPYQEPASKDMGSEENSNLDNTQVEEDSTWQFLHKLGYEMKADEQELSNIRHRKNEIIDTYISRYEENNKQNQIYLVYEDGFNLAIKENEDLKEDGGYAFKNVGENGSCIVESDLDLGDANFKSNGEFSGLFDGQNHTLSNIHITLSFSKKASLEGADGALFKSLSNATFKNITFKDMVLEISAPAGVDVTAAVFALKAENCIFENVVFDGLKIISGNGDTGRAVYKISDFIMEDNGSVITNVTATNVNYSVSEFAQIQSAF